ncbi:MAG: hypothetical protein KKE02_04180 [Alphaproteobacteria bacterium]|nr:hypothetical protein [Alphaproteobacteria bacterium]MBU1513620.1 hypothetical protein [Alphaproteobacteria bacterium]MBU2094735.1 hypothetical protein [Alphaproteobacteria bacterium]MBU2150196.1 hypothetical protein [Alphaproteobacteria bacterium]MBU2309275.1 hypothetical protein [Alphaproteobacteria bacterium]
MWDALDITDEDAAGLAEIAQHDLALARDFARRALAATDNDEANQLARSYQRAARSYRQTLAVKARLKRDLTAAARTQADTPRSKPGGAAVARRITELRTALMRLAWDEAEPPETDGLGTDAGETAEDFGAACEAFADRRADIEILISRACLKPDFGAAPLDDDVAGLALDMGLAAEAIGRWRELPDPPQAALDTEVDGLDWRSSA